MSSELTKTGWYTLVNNNALEQGDLLNRFPILIPPYHLDLGGLSPETPSANSIKTNIDVQFFNVIVITQTCDLVDNADEDNIILCPRFSYKEITKDDAKTYGANGWSNLVRNRMIGKYLLNKCEIQKFELDYQLVDLRLVFSVPYGLVKKRLELETTRLQLISPYREQLSLSFAYQYMRIGLEEDLPSKYPL